jgi:hypothetical protein
MRRRSWIAGTIGAGMFIVMGLAGPAGAADPPGRAASGIGLANALIKQRVVEDAIGDVIPTESVSLNFGKTLDPDQPGVTPGGGGIEP